MELSVALIVKNEAKVLDRCLSSVKGADEYVVVDTGSSDNTKEIAKRYTDKIYNFKWCDDFEKARNYALKKCTKDWILFMDADWVLSNSIDDVKKSIAGDAVSVKLVASSGGHHFLPVLFKKGLVYKGKVHETISPKDKRDSNLEITYYPSANKTPERNLNILKTMKKTPRTLFYLGKEYYDLKRYEEAMASFDEYLSVSNWLEEKAEAYYYKAVCLWRTNQGSKARETNFEAIKLNPDMKKALELAGEMHYEPWKSKWANIAYRATNKDVIFR
jgi:glycosyltransferase involved in cell wall biosynthesis